MIQDDETIYLTTRDLQVRWQKKDRKVIYRLAKTYGDVLRPLKIGGGLLFDIVDIQKFEKNMRAYRGKSKRKKRPRKPIL